MNNLAKKERRRKAWELHLLDEHLIAIGHVANRDWTVGDLLDAALATQPITTAPDRRKRFRVIDGGKA